MFILSRHVLSDCFDMMVRGADEERVAVQILVHHGE